MILIPSEEEIREQKANHAAMNAVWQSVLQGRMSPASIAYVLTPPGKLSKVRFCWSTEEQAKEAEAVAALELLSPADGLSASRNSGAQSHWIGVGPEEQEYIYGLRSAAFDSVNLKNESAAEEKWCFIINRCETRLGAQFPETAEAYFGLADCYWDFDRYDDHNTEFEKGLQILEKCFQRSPYEYAYGLKKRLIEFARVYLSRNDLLAARAQYAKLDRLKAAAPADIGYTMKPDWSVFARWYEHEGLLEQAEQAYLTHAASLSGVDLGTEGVVILEIADFFARHEQYDKAEGFYEQLLVPFLVSKSSPDRWFHWFMNYKKILHAQGRSADLKKLNERLAGKEIAAERRLSDENALGYIDRDGTWQIVPHYLEASNFMDGVATVKIAVEGANDCQERRIDRQGKDLGPANLVELLACQLPAGYSFGWPQKFSEGLAVVGAKKPDSPKNDYHVPRLYGYCDETGEIVIAPQFTDAEAFRNGRAVVAQGGYIGGNGGCVIELQQGRYGLIDGSGNFVITPQFRALKYFTETLYRYHGDATGGVIDRDGKIVTELPKCYDSFYLEEEGDETASAQWGEEQKHGYLDAQGKVFLPAQFDYACRFSDGLAAAQIDRKWGYIDKTGKFVIAPQFDWAESFVDGVAIVRENEKQGCIDKQGNLIVDIIYDRIDKFQDGFAQFRHNGKLGLVNNWGMILCEPKYDRIDQFSKGGAVVVQSGKMGMIDGQGRLIVPLQFVGLQPFYEGLAAAAIQPDGSTEKLWGFIDCSGAFVIAPAYSGVDHFSEGLAGVGFKLKSGDKAGYIDTAGNTIIAPQYDYGDFFRDGRARVGIGPRNNRLYGIIDRSGNYILKPEYKVVQNFSEGLCVAGCHADA